MIMTIRNGNRITPHEMMIQIIQYTLKHLNPRIALGGKKSPSSVFESVKILFSIGRCPFVTFPEYEVGTQCNNRCTRSCLAWRQTRVNFFESSEILWSCWLIWQNRSRISIVVIQVTKSNFPTTATSKKVSPNDSNNERQPEIAIWPPKPEILISLELWQIASKFQRQFWGFRTMSSWNKVYCCRFRFGRPYCYFRLWVVVTIIWGHFL